LIRWARVDLATGDLTHDGGEEQLPAASTIKLFVASAFWRSDLDPNEVVEVEPTGESFAEALRAPLPLADLATLMLSVSDNAATNALIELLGFDALNAEIRRLGLDRTVVRRKMLADGPENLTTAADLARGLAQLAEDERIVGPLRLSQHSDLRALLGDDVDVASKSGELPSVRHEVSLLGQRERRLVLALCSSPPALPTDLAAQGARLWRKDLQDLTTP
jgi:beta-lactamase class A